MNDVKQGISHEAEFDEHEILSMNDRDISGWAVPWSDLMMVMFVLFVVLFVYAEQKGGADKALKAMSQPPSPMSTLVDRISAHTGPGKGSLYAQARDVAYRSKSNAVDVTMDNDGRVRICLRGNLFFGPDQPGLHEAALPYLEEVADVVKLTPHPIMVVGHSDESDEAAGKGFALSAQRASAVAALLMEKANIDPRRISIVGRGPFDPESPGFLTSGSSNRRVEIILMSETSPDHGGRP